MTKHQLKSRAMRARILHLMKIGCSDREIMRRGVAESTLIRVVRRIYVTMRGEGVNG